MRRTVRCAFPLFGFEPGPLLCAGVNGEATTGVAAGAWERRLRTACDTAAARLLAGREGRAHWTGDLSASALSTATAIIALSIAEGSAAQHEIERGLRWLSEHPNDDGGWGDTLLSRSNISTTALVWAAFGANREGRTPTGESWLRQRVEVASDAPGEVFFPALTRAILERYGKDRTFSVPILTACALTGRLGEGRQAWASVLPLPFELAALPHQVFALARLPVVSYALPALIAIGQAGHCHRPTRNPFLRLIRNGLKARTLRVLTSIQPTSGGFLEATPLTSFVVIAWPGAVSANIR